MAKGLARAVASLIELGRLRVAPTRRPGNAIAGDAMGAATGGTGMAGAGEVEDLARALIAACRERRMMLATAESCTGGLIAAALTAIPGASDVFDRGFVTYSYPSKTALLGVPPDLLHAHGAVSEPVARRMAEGALAASQAGLALSVTGVAGPGGSEQKPEGLVWFAIALPGETYAERRCFGALGRASVRARSVQAALELARQAVARLP